MQMKVNEHIKTMNSIRCVYSFSNLGRAFGHHHHQLETELGLPLESPHTKTDLQWRIKTKIALIFYKSLDYDLWVYLNVKVIIDEDIFRL